MNQSRFGCTASGDIVDLQTGAPPTLDEIRRADAAHLAMFQAEEAFESALRTKYGDRAGDMRYHTGALPAPIRALALDFQAKSAAWRATWRTA